MSEDCLFCKIVRGEVPAAIIHADEHTVAFRDINPQAPTHVLVIPRTHVSNAAGVIEHAQVWGPLMASAAAIARAEGREDAGYRLVVNSGADAGQTVDHLHVHVLGGRPFAWPPG